MKLKLGNLTLLTKKANCNKSCPFCIAKGSNKKYNDTTTSPIYEFDSLENILESLEKLAISFERFVLSGNGEPSFYSYEELLKIVTTLKKHSQMFDGIRLHTSGNIFFDYEKFALFNSLENIEFNILRVAFNNKKDQEILKYPFDYTETECFKIARNIKLDIALTDILETQHIIENLVFFLKKYPNIKTVRLKDLLSPSNTSFQANWIHNHSLPFHDVSKMIEQLKTIYTPVSSLGDKRFFKGQNGYLIYGSSGDMKYYDRDLLIFNNELLNYDETRVEVNETFVKRFNNN